MKSLLSGIAAAFLLSLASVASAGTLTIQDGLPSFLPESSFTDNSITADLLHNPPGVMGDVVRLLGDSLVGPAAESPRILIGGDFPPTPATCFRSFMISPSTSPPLIPSL
ncbi:MAG: hypothetical protein H0W43_06010 [Chthoniobacterales bacterium]|nr:hypothetical protein [Chthoniobacterales bacterium]